MMTEEQALALPKKAANRAEVDSYYILDAFYNEFERIELSMEKRARLVPGGWRDLRLVKSKLSNLLLGLGGTFETEKARQIKRMGQSVRIDLKFNKQAVRDADMILVDMEELGILITAASGECKLRMCAPHECRRCQLGRTLDKLSWVSRDGRAWWEVFGQLVRDAEDNDRAE